MRHDMVEKMGNHCVSAGLTAVLAVTRLGGTRPLFLADAFAFYLLIPTSCKVSEM